MVDGLERSDAQRIAALEARVTELERGNPTCVCGAYTPKRDEFPLPWRKESVAQFPNHWNIFAANNQIVTTLFDQHSIDRILSLASRLEAAEKVVRAANYAVESFHRSAEQQFDEGKWVAFCVTKAISGLVSTLSAYDKSLAGEGGR